MKFYLLFFILILIGVYTTQEVKDDSTLLDETIGLFVRASYVNESSFRVIVPNDTRVGETATFSIISPNNETYKYGYLRDESGRIWKNMSLCKFPNIIGSNERCKSGVYNLNMDFRKSVPTGTHQFEVKIYNAQTKKYSVHRYKFKISEAIVCPPKLFNCNGKCTNRMIDDYNCGSCGNICSSGQSCNSGKCSYFDSFCSPIVYNGNPLTKINFIIGFKGLTQREINEKGRDLARAQFFRSEYKDRASDPLFGFHGDPEFYPAQVGLFELEPFSNHSNDFNVFYLTAPMNDSVSPDGFADKHCNFRSKYRNAFLKDTYAKIKVLRKTETTGSGWKLEEMGTAWNHEFGHTFGLADEYYTTMDKNNLNLTQIVDWNRNRPNCDYSRPSTAAGYRTGQNYCTKWCSGVDPTNYQTYLSYRNLFDQCKNRLTAMTSGAEWLNFCMNNLNYTRMLAENRGKYLADLQGTTLGLGARLNTNDLELFCNTIYSANWTDASNKKYGVDNFCYSSSVYNVWDLNLGNSCVAGTGCYFGCGGFAIEAYPTRDKGAFGDSFRSNLLSGMGGGKFGESSAGTWINVGTVAHGVPSYGAYDIHIIESNIREKLAGIIAAPAR